MRGGHYRATGGVELIFVPAMYDAPAQKGIDCYWNLIEQLQDCD